jgi:hypothetical protein
MMFRCNASSIISILASWFVFSQILLVAVLPVQATSTNSTATVFSSQIGIGVSGLRGGNGKLNHHRNSSIPLTQPPRHLQVTGEITGAFDIVTLARFNDVAGGWFQRVFDFGNGAGQDNVWL